MVMALSTPLGVAALKATVSVLAKTAATHTMVLQHSARKTKALGGQDSAKTAMEPFPSVCFANALSFSATQTVF